MSTETALRVQWKVVLAVLTTLLGVSTAVMAYEDYVWGEAAAEYSNEVGVSGYWKYCVTVSWDVTGYTEGPHALSHATVLLGLEECLAECHGACLVFPDTVGAGLGEDGCSVYYYAELDLPGDPTVPEAGPTIKFEPYMSPCEPDLVGTISVCFYAAAPPRAVDAGSGTVWIKFGPHVEDGPIEGVLPSCAGTSALDDPSWGSIKRLFR